MAQKPSDNPRINKLIELEVAGRIKPEHQQELDTYRAQGIAPKKSVGSATESERTAGFLATRVAGAMGTLADIDRTDPDAAKPPLAPEIVRMVTPQRFEDAAANAVTPESRQRVEAAQLELLDAALTLGTGAAYTREQLEGYRRSYFPQMGDDPGTIADKRQRLKVVLEAAKVKAGAAAPSIDQALAKAYGGAAPEAPTSTATQLSVGVNPLEQAVEAAAGASQADNQAAFEAEFRDAYAKGADRGALLAIGQRYGIAPNEQELDAALAARARGETRLTITGSPPPSGGAPATPATPEGRGGGGAMETADAVVRGAADTVTLGLADEIAALAGTVTNPDSTLRENLDRERATDRFDTENNFGARLTGQLVGGAALPLGAARTPVALARTGAAYGGAYGFGSGEGMGDRVTGALGGAAAGGALAGLVGAGARGASQALQARRIARGGTVATAAGTERQALVAAADRQGVELPAALTGGPVARQATAVLAQTPGGIQPLANAAERITDQSQAAVGRIASGVGQAADPEAAGEAARKGALSFIKSSGTRKNRLYQIAETRAGDTPVDLQLARTALDEHIAELSQVPGGSALLPKLQALRAEMDRPATVKGVRGMRTVLRKQFLDGQQFLSGNDERIIGDIVRAASDDVASSLRGAGKADAAAAYKAADDFNRQRAEVIEQTLQPIIGKRGAAKSGEQVLAAINQAARGNAQRLEQFMRALPPEEAGVVRATIIDRLGRATSGQQDDAGQAFSLQTFLTNWDKIETGRKTLFDPATRSALDDLAKIASANRDAGRYLNTSKTGGVVAGILTGGTLAIDIGTLGATLAAQYGGARLLASPRFARWLARAPRTRDTQAHMAQLQDIATKEAAIAPEIMGFQQRLTEALGQEPARVAATDENNE